MELSAKTEVGSGGAYGSVSPPSHCPVTSGGPFRPPGHHRADPYYACTGTTTSHVHPPEYTGTGSSHCGAAAATAPPKIEHPISITDLQQSLSSMIGKLDKYSN